MARLVVNTFDALPPQDNIAKRLVQSKRSAMEYCESFTPASQGSESVAFCHTYIDRFMSGVFDSDPRLLNHIQVGSSHCQGGVSAESTQVAIRGQKQQDLQAKARERISLKDDDPGEMYAKPVSVIFPAEYSNAHWRGCSRRRRSLVVIG